MRLSDLVSNLPSVSACIGDDVDIENVRADSRRVGAGDLFIAIPGGTVDGHRFISEAVGAGAVAVIGERPPEAVAGGPGDSFAYAQVADAREAWAWCAALWEGLPSRDLTLIGVTGTDGKTTTVSLIRAILEAAGIRAGMISTVTAIVPSLDREGWEELDTGLHTTTPDPTEIQGLLAQMVARGATHAVLEVTSHGLAQHRVSGCEFDVAVVTNVTHEHLDYHGSLEAYKEAKARLFASLSESYRKPGVPKIAVLNRDDDSFGYLRHYESDRQITYALSGRADVTARELCLERDGSRFQLHTAAGEVTIQTLLVGAYNVSNILAAASVGIGLGVSLEDIAKGVGSAAGVPGRMERIDEGQPFLALVDFAHTPNALRETLQAARDMAGEGRVIVVFGSAGLRDREKRRLMGRVAARLADVVIVTAEDPRTESLDAIMRESGDAAELEGKRAGEDLLLIRDRGEAILRGCQMAHRGDVVIACGKGHEQSMCFGQTEYPWDDRTAMRLALKGKTLDTLPTAGEETRGQS